MNRIYSVFGWLGVPGKLFQNSTSSRMSTRMEWFLSTADTCLLHLPMDGWLDGWLLIYIQSRRAHMVWVWRIYGDFGLG